MINGWGRPCSQDVYFLGGEGMCMEEIYSLISMETEEKSQPHKALGQEGSGRGKHRAKMEDGKEAR